MKASAIQLKALFAGLAPISVAAIALSTIAPVTAQTKSNWQNICPSEIAQPYCDNIGKSAYNAQGTRIMRSVKLGKIIGVAWRPKGSLVGQNPTRTARRDAFYYIIDDGYGPQYSFIRMAREIRAE